MNTNTIYKEELFEILNELFDEGFDIKDEFDIKMGLGACLGFDKEDQKMIIKSLKKEHLL